MTQRIEPTMTPPATGSGVMAAPPPPPQVIYVHAAPDPGRTAAIVGCIFGVLGIISLGVIFFWIALVCCIVAHVKSGMVVIDPSRRNGGLILLADVLTILAFLTSPGVWIQIAWWTK